MVDMGFNYDQGGGNALDAGFVQGEGEGLEGLEGLEGQGEGSMYDA